MKLSGVVSCAIIFLQIAAAPVVQARAQQGSAPSAGPPIHVTSSLVYLDVTVLDKKGQPVVNGLTKDDFTITEDNKPQPIFSFEAPQTHVVAPGATDENTGGKAPVTIFVLDLLNSSFSDFAYIRGKVRHFLRSQPSHLPSPAELMVLGDESLEMLQGYTRSRADLLYALAHLQPAIPYKTMNDFGFERFAQSIEALQQIALQNKGVPARKNIIWVGSGGPGIMLDFVRSNTAYEAEVKEYAHATTNMLVDARVSLFVVYPGISARGGISLSEFDADVVIGNGDPFSGDINFGVFANETGGKFFYNRNDLDNEIKESQRIGSEYYTLTYQPQNVGDDGKFLRVRVTLRDPNLHAVTKTGYFAPDKKLPIQKQQQTTELAEALETTIALHSLDLTVADIVQHPDSRTADLTMHLRSKNLTFMSSDDAGRIQQTGNLILGAASLDRYGTFLASRFQNIILYAAPQNPILQPNGTWQLHLTIRVPRKTRIVRVAIEDQDGGRIGAAEIDRKAIDAAPQAPTPSPELKRRAPPNAP